MEEAFNISQTNYKKLVTVIYKDHEIQIDLDYGSLTMVAHKYHCYIDGKYAFGTMAKNKENIISMAKNIIDGLI